jgi:hypothetical protein
MHQYTYIGRFLRQVRRGCPEGEIRVALDQDARPSPPVATNPPHDASIASVPYPPAQGPPRG